MRTIPSSDVSKLLLFLLATFLLAALLVPHVYNAGQFTAEITSNKTINPLVDYLGTHARKADYARFFNRSLYLASLILLPFLLFSLGAKKTIAKTPGPWSFALPARSIAPNRGQPLVRPPHPIRQIIGGFLMGTVFLLAAGALAMLIGFFQWKGQPIAPAVPGALTTAAIVAILEEFIFRGIILGIFLRSFRPSIAIVLVAFLFGALHFIRPPEGAIVANPEGALAGFAFLELTASRLLDGHLILQQFAPLFLVGVLLGVTRYLTSSLWLPIGLHTGWVFAFTLFGDLTIPIGNNPEWMSLMIGSNLAQGLLPLGALFVSGLIIWVVYREPDYYESPSPDSPLDPAPL
ncbi:MAG: CPBP family intramembrane glutamic endopeptidase [Roseibacillus sp.]